VDYLKAFHNVGTFKYKARVAALETMAIQKQKQPNVLIVVNQDI
jgi:hypothetical protein